MDASASPLLHLRDLRVSYGPARAVNGLSLTVRRGETAAIVGESGSGKSQTVLAALRLLPRHALTTGSVLFDGTDLLGLSQKRLDALLGRRIAMVFQEPMSSLDPLFSVGAQIGAVLRLKARLPRGAAKARAKELLTLAGIAEPERRLDAYPHELSGGQRQRVAIAMAISCNPELLIADEPTTALDVTVAAKIMELLATLKQNLGMAMIFISHDLGMVRRIADTIHVMRGGEIVETGPAREIFAHPRHDYTRMLLRACRAGAPMPGSARRCFCGPRTLASLLPCVAACSAPSACSRRSTASAFVSKRAARLALWGNWDPANRRWRARF